MLRKTRTGGPFKHARAENHHIVRVGRSVEASRCWKVNLKRRGKYMFKVFRDDAHGGKVKALKAAKAWRDSLMRAHSGADYTIWRRNRTHKGNRSGVVGVGRYIARDNGGKRPFWLAFWHTADGVRQSSKFSVLKYGEKHAKQLACEARRNGMEELRRELVRRRIVYGS
jgi:hypothetical protein